MIEVLLWLRGDQAAAWLADDGDDIPAKLAGFVMSVSESTPGIKVERHSDAYASATVWSIQADRSVWKYHASLLDMGFDF